ncbi:hypothetical protein BH10PSE1_BH10PSE1_00960 [soil metagenome]
MKFTALEQSVVQALAWDLRDVAPDLAGQFEESLPGARRNTGFGLFTEMIVNPRRPAPAQKSTGSYGTVHAMVGDLPGSMAFKAVLRDGVLLGVEGDAFDMETDQIDFATTPFRTVFTVDDQGKSVWFDPAAITGTSPLRQLQTWERPEPSPPTEEPRLVNIGALQRVQDVAGSLTRTFPVRDKPIPLKLDESQTSLFIGLCVAIGALALLACWLLRIPLAFAIFVTFWLGRGLRHPKALAWVSRTLARFQIAFDERLKAARKR